MKVLVADKFEKSGIAGLEGAGCEVVYEPDLKDDALASAIASTGADVLVVRSTKVPTSMRDAGACRCRPRGAGKHHRVAGASSSGIYVSKCPLEEPIAGAELAFALSVLDRRIPDNVADCAPASGQ